MPHSNVFVNVRRTLVPLTAVRALKSRLFSAVVLHVSLQRLLVCVTGVTPGTVVCHLAGLPEGPVFMLDLVPTIAIVCSQDVQYTGVVGLQESSYKQEERESRLVGIANTDCARCSSARTEKNITEDTIKERRTKVANAKRPTMSRMLLQARGRSGKVEQQGRDKTKVKSANLAHQMTG